MRELSKEALDLQEYLLSHDMNADTLALCLEAVRLKDRLDHFDELLRGDEEIWCELTTNSSGITTVSVDKALLEARQSATAFRQLLDAIEIRLNGNGDNSGGGADVLSDLG